MYPPSWCPWGQARVRISTTNSGFPSVSRYSCNADWSLSSRLPTCRPLSSLVGIHGSRAGWIVAIAAQLSIHSASGRPAAALRGARSLSRAHVSSVEAQEEVQPLQCLAITPLHIVYSTAMAAVPRAQLGQALRRSVDVIPIASLGPGRGKSCAASSRSSGSRRAISVSHTSASRPEVGECRRCAAIRSQGPAPDAPPRYVGPRPGSGNALLVRPRSKLLGQVRLSMPVHR